MNFLYKPNWLETKQRYKQWWAHEYSGRCSLWVTAPKKDPLPVPEPPKAQSIEQKWYDLDWISAQNDYRMAHTFYGGESFPRWSGGYPGHTSIASYLGCPTTLDWSTGWSSPILKEKDIEFGDLKINKNDRNYLFSLELLRRGVKEAKGRSMVSIGAFGGSGDTLAALRGTEQLLFDCIERPDQVRAAEEFLMDIWLDYYDTLYDILKEEDEGTTCWYPLWAPGKFYAPQNDFAYNISPHMYQELFLPVIKRQVGFLNNCIYHVDGVNNFVHIDSLLKLPELQAFQIAPGVGKPDVLTYMDVLKKVQKAGRNLWIAVDSKNIRFALENLSARGLHISTRTDSEDQSKELLKNVERWSVDRG